jgi:Bacterial type II/III secretion system short domain
MSSKILCCWLVCSVLGVAQAPESTKLYRLQYALADHVAGLLGPMGFVVKGDNGMHAVVVRGTAERQAEAERLISELDRPGAGIGQQDVETTVYVLAASNASGSEAPLPPSVDPVIKQLRTVFAYSNYQLLGTILMRSRDEQYASTQGLLKNRQTGPDQKASNYVLNYRASVDESRRMIHFDSFGFRVSGHEWNADFQTSLDLREGQKVVVGKSNIDDGSAAIFAVLMARTPDESANAPHK